MTPDKKTKFKDQAQCRALTLVPVLEDEGKRLQTDKYVEGYAAKYDTYLLYDAGEWGKTFERF